jgi:gamma-resorcylate decarboxylase
LILSRASATALTTSAAPAAWRRPREQQGEHVQGKIALEEHFATADTIDDSKVFLPERLWPSVRDRLLEFQDRMLEGMDRHGIEMMLVSLNAPAVQAIVDAERAIEVARVANDVLAERMARRAGRFAGLAALPLQDPDAAARELTRCVTELGFVGALANGFSQGPREDSALYYDLPQYRPFWEVVERLDVPFYLHPRNPLPSWAPIYQGHTWLLGPTWAFTAESAAHALRLMCSGLFDERPRLKIVIGHLGEGLPYSLWRIDNRNHWMAEPPKYPARKRIAEYFRANFWITTSGNFSTPTLHCAIEELGAERIMFSVDYPFEDIGEAASWFDAAPLGHADRHKIGRANAIKLFKLPIGPEFSADTAGSSGR